MNKKYSLLLLAAALLLMAMVSGCGTAKSVSMDQSWPGAGKLDKAPVYMAIPPDALVPGSGVMAANIMKDELTRHASNVMVEDAPADLDATLLRAKELGNRYAFIPTIEKWESPANPAKNKGLVALDIQVYDLLNDLDALPIMHKRLVMKGSSGNSKLSPQEFLCTHLAKQFAVSAY